MEPILGETISEIERYLQDLYLTRDIIESSTIEPQAKNEFLNKLADIEKEFSQVRKESYTVAVLGGWNNGKSTFINALLGNSLLPMKNKSYTSAVTRIRYADKRKLTFIYSNGESAEKSIKDISSLELDKYVTTDAESDQTIREVIIDYPFESCNSGIELIDTPGVNSINETHDQIALNAINDADLFIILLKANHAGSQGDIEYLKSIIEQKKEREFSVLFVLNKSDGMTEEEIVDAKESLKVAISMIKKENKEPVIKRPNIITVSAYFEYKANLYLNKTIDFIEVIDDEKLYFEDSKKVQQQIANPEEIDKVRMISNFSTLLGELNREYQESSRTITYFDTAYSKLLALIAEMESYIHEIKVFLSNGHSLEDTKLKVAALKQELSDWESDINANKIKVLQAYNQIIEKDTPEYQIYFGKIKEVSAFINKLDYSYSLKQLVNDVRNIVKDELENAVCDLYEWGEDKNIQIENSITKSYQRLFELEYVPNAAISLKKTAIGNVSRDPYWEYLIRTQGKGAYGYMHSFFATYIPKDPFNFKSRMKEYVEEALSKYFSELFEKVIQKQKYLLEKSVQEQKLFFIENIHDSYKIKMKEFENQVDQQSNALYKAYEDRSNQMDQLTRTAKLIKTIREKADKEHEKWKQSSQTHQIRKF
jgi:GTPase Era involved in 16S rRNA processing